MRSWNRSLWVWSVGLIGLVVGAVLIVGAGAGVPLAAEVWADEGFEPPAWSQILKASKRFKLVMGDAAVLDKETGLVWEQSPVTTTHLWSDARFQCTGRTTGGRQGWRLPSVHELASLVDPSVASPGPTLPAGHPFTDVQPNFHWSATTNAEFSSSAWEVSFNNGLTHSHDKSNSDQVWCVRGGHNDGDAY